MPWAGFEPSIPATKRTQTYASDGVPTGIGMDFNTCTVKRKQAPVIAKKKSALVTTKATTFGCSVADRPKKDKSVPLHKALNAVSRASEGVFCQREEVWFPTRSWPWCGHSHLFVHSQDTLWNAVDSTRRPSYTTVSSLLGVVPP
jgi:hypothetical protein